MQMRSLAVAMMLLAAPVVARAQGIITTVAGSTWVFRGDGSAALNAPLGLVTGVAADSSGNVYITDIGNHMVFKVSAGGVVTVLAGNGIQWFSGDGGTGNTASVNTPTGVAVDAAGNVYFADTESHRVRRITPSGIIATVAGSGDSGYSGDGGPATSATLAFPSGVAIDSSGNLYIADRYNHRIRRVSAGLIATIAGTGADGYSGDGGAAGSARLGGPRGVAVDSSGNVYIADSNNHRVRKLRFPPASSPPWPAMVRLASPATAARR